MEFSFACGTFIGVPQIVLLLHTNMGKWATFARFKGPASALFGEGICSRRIQKDVFFLTVAIVALLSLHAALNKRNAEPTSPAGKTTSSVNRSTINFHLKMGYIYITAIACSYIRIQMFTSYVIELQSFGLQRLVAIVLFLDCS